MSINNKQNQDLFRTRVKADKLAEFISYIQSEGVTSDSVQFLCIGTDRSTGDAVGPLVGSMLEEAGYSDVIGTLAFPCDSSNLSERLSEIRSDRKVLAIDACLGHPSSVGQFQVSNGPLLPGKSLGKGLPPAGDYSIAAIVGIDGPKAYAVLQTTSLHRVIMMARAISDAIKSVYPLQ
jgi:putative sporulation protein YyaC